MGSRTLVFSLVLLAATMAFGTGSTPAESTALREQFCVAVNGDFLYVCEGANSGDEGYGLTVLDISTPETPQCVDRIPIDISFPYRTRIFGALACVVDGTALFGVVKSGVGRVAFLDVAQPNMPFVAGYYESDFLISDVAIRGSRAYLATTEVAMYQGLPQLTNGGIAVLDVSSPASPVLINRVALTAPPFSLAIVGDSLAVGSFSISGAPSLLACSLADVDSPAVVGTHSLAGSMEVGGVWDLDTSGNSVYVATQVMSLMDMSTSLVLESVDVSTPSALASLGSLELWQSEELEVAVTDIESSGGILYAANESYALHLIDVMQPGGPVLLGQFLPPDEVPWVAVKEDTAYITDLDNGVLVLECSTPSAPSHVGTYVGDCSAVPPDYTLQFLEQWDALVEVLELGVEPIDLDTDGVPERWILAVVAAILSNTDAPYHAYVINEFVSWQGMLASISLGPLAPLSDCLAALAVVNPALLDTILGPIDPEKEIAGPSGSSPPSPLAGDADLDGDGLTNAEEYHTVVGYGGSMEAFVNAVLYWPGAGSLPVGGLGAMGLLVGALAAVAVRRVRR